MTIAFTIPVWVFWLLGVPIGLLLLLFTFIGGMIVWGVFTSKRI